MVALLVGFQGPRLLAQHDRDAVADRKGQAGGTADQLLLLGVVLQGFVGPGRNQDLQQLRIDGGFLACHG
jgi:hypothetical protein